jgi:hypothetical protein
LLGIFVTEEILFIADLLKDRAAPGLATLVLLVGLVCLVAIFARTMASRLAAINWLRRLIANADQGQSFAWAVTNLDRKIAAETKG